MSEQVSATGHSDKTVTEGDTEGAILSTFKGASCSVTVRRNLFQIFPNSTWSDPINLCWLCSVPGTGLNPSHGEMRMNKTPVLPFKTAQCPGPPAPYLGDGHYSLSSPLPENSFTLSSSVFWASTLSCTRRQQQLGKKPQLMGASLGRGEQDNRQ